MYESCSYLLEIDICNILRQKHIYALYTNTLHIQQTCDDDDANIRVTTFYDCTLNISYYYEYIIITTSWL